VPEQPSVWSSPLLRSLEGEDLQALLDLGRVAHAAPGGQLLRPDDDLIVVLARGKAKAHVSTRDGDRLITALLGPGDAWGFTAVLGYRVTGIEVSALEALDALTFPGAEFRSLLEQRAKISTVCLHMVSHQLAVARADAIRFAGTTTAERVTSRLLELAIRWGRREQDRVMVTVPLTQEELAAWAGSSRESTTKVLQSLRRAGIVATGRRSLTVLDLPRLRARCPAGALAFEVTLPAEPLHGVGLRPGTPGGG
jgi:CRP/FNR family transcriptional regulator, cyclic AMP receptor protein